MPHYLSFGVSKAEIMDSTPYELEPYERAEDLKIERQNYLNWVNGIYMMDAIGACFSKDCKYPEEPIRITQLTELEQQEKVRKAREKVIAFFSAMETKAGEQNE